MMNLNCMKKTCGVVAMAIAMATSAWAAPVADLSGGQTGRIEFASRNPENRWTLIRGNLGSEQTVYGDLLMPKKMDSKVPAVVFSHGSDGVSSLYFDVWAKALNDAGYAVFVVDSFTPRGRDNILGPERQLNYNVTVNIADALYALKLLSTHPQIDSNRIYHMGWSRGANAAHDAAWPVMQQHILPKGMKWAGTVPVYPGCAIRHRVDKHGKLPSPMFLVLAEKDDNASAEDCVKYSKEMADAGNAMTYKVYAGAYHVFDRLNQPWRQSRQGIFLKCDMDVNLPSGANDPGWKGGFDHKTGKPLATADDLTKAYQACQTVGYVTAESNNKAREAAVKDVIEFFDKNK